MYVLYRLKSTCIFFINLNYWKWFRMLNHQNSILSLYFNLKSSDISMYLSMIQHVWRWSVQVGMCHKIEMCFISCLVIWTELKTMSWIEVESEKIFLLCLIFRFITYDLDHWNQTSIFYVIMWIRSCTGMQNVYTIWIAAVWDLQLVISQYELKWKSVWVELLYANFD